MPDCTEHHAAAPVSFTYYYGGCNRCQCSVTLKLVEQMWKLDMSQLTIERRLIGSSDQHVLVFEADGLLKYYFTEKIIISKRDLNQTHIYSLFLQNFSWESFISERSRPVAAALDEMKCVWKIKETPQESNRINGWQVSPHLSHLHLSRSAIFVRCRAGPKYSLLPDSSTPRLRLFVSLHDKHVVFSFHLSP